ncbi:hypothetical protein ACIU1J_19455 [Azospirillum doebereinerae]|uniref:hypothetical protein n=1 Tax=Azospirillum doebereinerae TaxID=92933 RepID=UPI001EE5846D|nr:hypothetical protein [Azospirillum doebereinerae]MCG5241900.1 hypothetical protein [Azospirillum doebereinerae]
MNEDDSLTDDPSLPEVDGWIINLKRRRVQRKGSRAYLSLYELAEGGYSPSTMSGVDPAAENAAAVAGTAWAALQKHLKSLPH